MPNCCVLGLVGVLLFIGGCASHSANNAGKDEQVDLYLSTLDDKHFVWCKLDLAQCREDFENWKLTPRGRTIIREYEREATGETYNTHYVPNVFRTRFVDEDQLAEEIREQNGRQGVGQDSDAFGKPLQFHDEKSGSELEETPIIHRIYGPELPG